MRFHLINLLFNPLLVSALPAVLLSRSSELLASYDYVIIGGDTAGLAVANRLTENPKEIVLVIEAGPVLNGEEELMSLLIPGNFGSVTPRYQWNITSLPNKELNNRTTTPIVARIVGGGSALNGMMFDRGSRNDYNGWAELRSSPRLQRRCKRSGGLNMISLLTEPMGMCSRQHLIAAEKALGIPKPKDSTNGEAIGSYWAPNSLDPRGYTRSYSMSAYHDESVTRPNYHLLPEHIVTKILFKEGTAVGVEFSTGKSAPLQTVTAKKEVILSAGGIHSARLLQHSGIGDKRLLTKFDIPVVVDLPGVGNNFQDHSGASLVYNITLNPDPNWLTTQLNLPRRNA
ncbi:glucose-methanol-choline oxidoreductase [Wilcoxina mikolae CBS 423.85]|nr:glucose-methanol-choline oxidoreductase [Wilcoxina mikolae CBS 423.85]